MVINIKKGRPVRIVKLLDPPWRVAPTIKGEVMILEVAILDVKSGQEEEFEATFRQASAIISSMPGYVSHQLQRCVEKENRYILLAQWETLEAHTVGFRGSEQYQEWRKLLHHFYDPFPTVEHYEMVFENG
jgi:heme-degrading monooxygenase HmoA